MASIACDKNGNRRILFIAPDGRRPTIRLGKASQRTADEIKAVISDAPVVPKAAQKAAQQAHAEHRNDSQSPHAAHEKPPALQVYATGGENLQSRGMEAAGIEWEYGFS